MAADPPVPPFLRRGEIVTGTVIEIAPYFVTFVDVGGLTAFINVPELSWRPFDHPSEVVAIGEEIRAEVLDVDADRARVALSLKALQPDPLRGFRERQLGKVVTGTVTRLTPIGAFVRVEPVARGFEGLLHESRLAGRVLALGDPVTVRISRIDPTRRTIELTPEPPPGP